MVMQLPDKNTLISLVKHIAHQEITPRFQQVKPNIKKDGSLVTEADLAMNQALINALTHTWPEIPVLSEEMEKTQQLNLLETCKYCWCLDPLDGTTNFTAGIPFFAVSLALITPQGSQIGLVYDLSRQEVFYAEKGQGAYLNDEKLILLPWNSQYKPALGLVNLKRLDQTLKINLATNPPYSSQRDFGSCALEWCWMAAGRAQLYLHGGQKIWDLAAGYLIFEEAGGFCCTLKGEAVFKTSLENISTVGAVDKNLFLMWKKYLDI